MRIAMVSEHASPLAVLGGEDAGGQNVHVAALSVALARRGCEVTVYTRRDAPLLPRRVPLGGGVVVEHVVEIPRLPTASADNVHDAPASTRWVAAPWSLPAVPDRPSPR